MVISPTTQSTLLRHQRSIDSALRSTLDELIKPELAPFYGQMQYHLGWVDAQLNPTTNNPGKLLRPTLLLLAYEAAGAWELANEAIPDPAYLQRAIPASVAIELTHNFTLLHDDIEDGDTERRHRATLWKLWGIPQAINTGDGMFALARLALWKVVDQGVDAAIAVRLGEALDRASLVLAEGQYLDISFETRQDISVAMYLNMISRKTGALMGCAAEMGARLGTHNQEIIARLHDFGKAMGIAFQVRDDLLGVWATTAELGKTPAGDIYRRKKSLPVLHALEQANAQSQQILRAIYQQTTPVTLEQVQQVLAVFEHTQTKTYCREFLAKYCRQAHEALAHVPRHSSPVATRALNDMETLVHFVEAETKD
ncbi:MAG TPA: polyprenyl synthetase family protein [Ktedonobacteraceae bacterium]|nr:polyprenyl synthetase family protein [Ktedonobacteraceae bacterium]